MFNRNRRHTDRIVRRIAERELALSVALAELNNKIDALASVANIVEQKVAVGSTGVPEADVQAAADRLQPILDGLTAASQS